MTTQADVDAAHMRRCLELAAAFAGRTAPNPMVGCVIVGASGDVLAEGVHRAAGQPHAEADALARLGGAARGATLYCNLEPCRHRKHRRTSPCTDAILAAGVARVVYGVGDPIAAHAGGGRLLARAGLAVTAGVLREACRDLNRGFFSVARRGRPWIIGKAALSLDGKIATKAGESKWITGAAARADGRALRSQCDAIVVGVGTVLADDPRLTARSRDQAGAVGSVHRDPMRVIMDSQLRTPPSARVLPRQARGSGARAVIATTLASFRAAQAKPRAALGRRMAALVAAGAEIWPVPSRGRRVDAAALARLLAAHGCLTVWIEGGGEVHAAWLNAELTDELVLYVAPLIIGGAAPAWVGGQGVGRLGAAPRFAFAAPPHQVGDDLRLWFRRSHPRAI